MDENPEPIIAIFLLIALQRYHKKGGEKSKLYIKKLLTYRPRQSLFLSFPTPQESQNFLLSAQ